MCIRDRFSPAGYDIEIVEKHHNQKVDAPSGTALALADSINEACNEQYEYVYDRSQVRKKDVYKRQVCRWNMYDLLSQGHGEVNRVICFLSWT